MSVMRTMLLLALWSHEPYKTAFDAYHKTGLVHAKSREEKELNKTPVSNQVKVDFTR